MYVFLARVTYTEKSINQKLNEWKKRKGENGENGEEEKHNKSIFMYENFPVSRGRYKVSGYVCMYICVVCESRHAFSFTTGRQQTGDAVLGLTKRFFCSKPIDLYLILYILLSLFFFSSNCNIQEKMTN
jgi:hypothetical protein